MVPFGGLGSFGRLRSTSCTLRRSSGGFGSSSRYLLYPSAASGYLRRFFGGFGLPSENLLYPSVSPVRRTGGAGGLPLRQAPRGRCLASSWLKPRLNFGGVQAYRPLQSGEAFADQSVLMELVAKLTLARVMLFEVLLAGGHAR